MYFDKKNISNRPAFVVMKGIGAIVIDFRVEQKDIVKAIKLAKQLSGINN
jgi:3-dehydroquinate synthetase